jgi:four helix bundle protein
MAGKTERTIRTFEDMEVWIVCRELRRELSDLARTFPAEERYRLSDQLVRAARSVTANIAEGYGRFHYQENIQFVRQARGSLFEVIDHLTVACDTGYVDKEKFQGFRDRTIRAILIVNGFIRYLTNARSSPAERFTNND